VKVRGTRIEKVQADIVGIAMSANLLLRDGEEIYVGVMVSGGGKRALSRQFRRQACSEPN
jgi:hypothetical protein